MRFCAEIKQGESIYALYHFFGQETEECIVVPFEQLIFCDHGVKIGMLSDPQRYEVVNEKALIKVKPQKMQVIDAFQDVAVCFAYCAAYDVCRRKFDLIFVRELNKEYVVREIGAFSHSCQ